MTGPSGCAGPGPTAERHPEAEPSAAARPPRGPRGVALGLRGSWLGLPAPACARRPPGTSLRLLDASKVEETEETVAVRQRRVYG